MAVETIPFRDIEEHTKDMYEATLVLARRVRQIIAERAVEQEFEEIEDDLGLMEERPQEMEDYVEPEKPVRIALREFLQGELEWSYSDGEGDGDEDTKEGG
ncbi:MAG: DNA-directed RNA polymerase subunit omega [Fidelibacterota bacterium]